MVNLKYPVRIKLFGLPIIKVNSTVSGTVIDTYLFRIPFISIRIKDRRKINVNFTLLQKAIDWYKDRAINKSKEAIKQKFREGKPVKIMLMTSRPGMWNFDYLYPLLKQDKRFDVCVLIMPEKAYGDETMKKYMQEVSQELTEKNIPFICGYNLKTGTFIKPREVINPDIVFFTDFAHFHFYKNFAINRFRDKITFLNDYGYSVMLDQHTCNYELNNEVDVYFRPTYRHQEMAQLYMYKTHGDNVSVVGSPKLDVRFDEAYKVTDVWKPQSKSKKRIIWAPHHSDGHPKNTYQYNAFYVLSDFMLQLAEEYKDKVQFAFRPHPILRPKLNLRWGKEKTDAYFKKWEDLENGQISDGEFQDLFITSDAMIMDSCSFIAEYTAFDKPLLHTISPTSRVRLNEFGLDIYDCIYKADVDLEQSIRHFIDEVVLAGNDYLKEERAKVVKKYFSKLNGKTASENIYQEIVDYLSEQPQETEQQKEK